MQEQLQEEEDTLIELQMGRAEYILRLQNIPEQKGEDTMDVVSKLFATWLECSEEEVSQNTDMARRVSSAYIRKHGLSREIHVTFILNISQEKQCFYLGEKIKVLKHIPWRARRRRQRYDKLVSFLRENSIPYTVDG